MSAPIELDLDALKQLAEKATPGPWWIDSHGHHMVSQEDGHRLVFTTSDSMRPATRHPETGNLSHWPNDWNASFIAAANPAVVLELVRRLRVAEALNASRIEQIPTEAKMVMVFTDLIQEHPELRDQFEEFSEAIKKRCTSGRWTLVAFFPAGSDIQTLDAEQMRAAGWVRADQTT